MLRLLMTISLVILTTMPLSAAIGAKPRSLSGIGLLTMGAEMTLAKGAPPQFPVYKEPNFGRLGEQTANRLPGIAPAMLPVEGEWYAIVTATRPGWIRIIYDDAEREGWIPERKALGFRKWHEYLPGRRITLLPGIRKDYYLLRDEASLTSPPRETISRAGLLAVGKVEGDWIHVKSGGKLSGWLRWRDDNGRLVVLLNPQIKP